MGTYNPTGTITVCAGGGTLMPASGVTATITTAPFNNNGSGVLTTACAGNVLLTATGTNTLAGLNVNGGTLSLGSDSSVGGALNLGTGTATISGGGTLVFDDLSASTPRLNSAAVVSVNSGGLLLKTAVSGDTQVVPTLNAVGPATIALAPLSGSATISIGNNLSSAGWSSGSSILFSGTNLGGTGSSALAA